jgi:hypothetical protein
MLLANLKLHLGLHFSNRMVRHRSIQVRLAWRDRRLANDHMRRVVWIECLEGTLEQRSTKAQKSDEPMGVDHGGLSS